MQILECIKQLSQDPFTLEYLQLAEAMKHLIPFLEARDGPYVGRIHNQVCRCICKANPSVSYSKGMMSWIAFLTCF